MSEREYRFDSDGVSLSGMLWPPEHQPREPQGPLFVLCSGFMGQRVIHPARFARFLGASGYACFGFDYRGFRPSDGERGRVLLDEQVRDIVNAVDFARNLTSVRDAPVILLGWAMGAGLVMQAAPEVLPLAGLICLNGFYDGRRWLRWAKGDGGWAAFTEWAAARSGSAELVDPFEVYPLDPTTRKYVDEVLRKVSGFGGLVQARLAASILAFDAETQLERLAAVPLFLAHGRDNALHPPSEAISVFDAHRGPKRLHWVEGGHTEWMADDDARYLRLVGEIIEWTRSLPLPPPR